jgi:4a-hydroxytetrahydrobiopterin dehydratase
VLARAASTWFDTTSHGTGAALVGRIAELAEAAGDHPDIDVRATGVHVRTFTHDATR